MVHELFKKEYFDLYDFYVESEKEFREHPFCYQINNGFCYKGGLKPVYVVFSAVQTEEEALSLLGKHTLIETLEELKEEVNDSNLPEAHYFIHIIEKKIREIQEDKHRGDF